MHRLVEALALLVQGSRGQQADRPGQLGGNVGQDVAEQVAGHHHVELGGFGDQLHGGIVHVQVRQFDVGILLGDFADHGPPQLRDFKDVRLVHGANPPAPQLGGLKGAVGDTRDLILIIDHGVDAAPAAVVLGQCARFAEIKPAGQFTHDQEIQPFEFFGLEARGMRHAGHQRCGTQVGVQSQSLAQPEQAGLGAQRAVGSVVTGRTDRCQQYGVGVAGSLQGVGRQGIALRIDRRPPD